MFFPNGNHRTNRPWQGPRGAGNLGAFAGLREPSLVLTGAYGAPFWPSKTLPSEQRALPRAITRRQAKADRQLAAKGGAAYLTKPIPGPAPKRTARDSQPATSHEEVSQRGRHTLHTSVSGRPADVQSFGSAAPRALSLTLFDPHDARNGQQRLTADRL